VARILILSIALAAISPGCGPIRQWEPCQNPQCARCKGTGSFRCNQCLGSGYAKCSGNMFIAACDNGTTICRTCNGGGMYLDKQCYNCNGRGRMNCTECGGTGRASCKTCGGDGMAACGRWVVVQQK
jgi:hypothetical protein